MTAALDLAIAPPTDGGRHAIRFSLSFVGHASSCQYPADQVEKESDEDFTF